MSPLFHAIRDIVKKIVKLHRPFFSLEENQLKFKIDSDIIYNYPIENMEIKTRHDSFVLEAYTISSEELYIEYIHTDPDAIWNNSSLSYFVDLLKKSVRTEKIELLEKKEFPHYDFSTYRIDDLYNLNIIHIYEENKEVFIVDMKSNLYEELLKRFEKMYNYDYEKNSDISLYLNMSLVRNNAIEHYFSLAN